MDNPALFYRTPLGRMAQEKISSLLDSFLKPELMTCFYGYGSPYGDHIRHFFLYPDANFKVPPLPFSSVTCETQWPFPDLTFDCICMIHSFEHALSPRKVLSEARRVLKNDGRLIVIVPNRRGLWSRTDSTPFGFGLPYTMTQLKRTLLKNGFCSINQGRSLFFPPSNRLLQISSFFEKAGPWIFRKASGVILVEAIKDKENLCTIGAINFSELAYT